MLGAAVLVCTLIPVVLLRVIHAILAAVALAVRVAAKPYTGQLLAAPPSPTHTSALWGRVVGRHQLTCRRWEGR